MDHRLKNREKKIKKDREKLYTSYRETYQKPSKNRKT